VQLAETKIGLGPAKGKDFASSLGPCILTIDELSERAIGRPGVFDLKMTARINGQVKSQASFSDIYWSFGQIIAHVSGETPILTGEVIGSGTTGTACLLELTKDDGPWLKSGDIVELEIERIGLLRTTIQSHHQRSQASEKLHTARNFSLVCAHQSSHKSVPFYLSLYQCLVLMIIHIHLFHQAICLSTIMMPT